MKPRAARRVRCSAWLGALMVVMKSLPAGGDNLLWSRCRNLDDVVTEENGGQAARHDVAHRLRPNRDHASGHQWLSKVRQVIANGGENLNLAGALLGIGVSLGKPSGHELSWRQSVNIGGVVMPERLRKLGVWI